MFRTILEEMRPLMNEHYCEIKEMMPNGDGSYYVVVNTKTPDGLTVRMDVPSAWFEDVSQYKDLIVDNIIKLPQLQKEVLMQYGVSDE